MLPIVTFYNSDDDTEQTTYAFGNCDAGGYAPDSTGIEIHLWNDKAGASSEDMTDVRIGVRDSDGNEVELWTTNRWIEIKSSGVGGTAVDDAMTEYKKVGKDHQLWVGDIPKESYRVLYVRLHGPANAQEGNIALQIYAEYQDGATASIVEIVHFQDLRAADTDYIHAAITGTGASQDITTAITNPDYPRVATITTTNNDTPSGNVTITGLVRGVSDTDVIAIVAGGTGTGVKPFDTITNINIPDGVSASDDVTIGIGDILGLPKEIYTTSDVYKKKVNNADATAELSGKVNATYGTVDCGTIVANEEITIWYLVD